MKQGGRSRLQRSVPSSLARKARASRLMPIQPSLVAEQAAREAVAGNVMVEQANAGRARQRVLRGLHDGDAVVRGTVERPLITAGPLHVPDTLPTEGSTATRVTVRRELYNFSVLSEYV